MVKWRPRDIKRLAQHHTAKLVRSISKVRTHGEDGKYVLSKDYILGQISRLEELQTIKTRWIFF